MTTATGIPAELEAMRREPDPFFADPEQLDGGDAIELAAEPPGVREYLLAPEGAGHRRFFEDVLWIGADVEEGRLLGYWKGDADTFDGAPVIEIDNEGSCTVVAASMVDYLAAMVGADDPRLLDFCARAGLAPPGTAVPRAGFDDPEKRWEALADAERTRIVEEVPPRPLSRSPLTAAALGGVVVVSGNDDIRRNTGDNVTFLLDPATLTFELLRPVPSGSTWVHGGVDGLPSFLMYGDSRRLARYLVTLHPQTRFWKAGPPSPGGLRGGAATLLRGGLVLLAGGADGPNGTPATVRCELYDPADGTWAATGDLATARHRPVVAPAGDGALVVAGETAGSAPSAACERFDPATGTWTAAADLPFPIDVCAALSLSDGKVLAVGMEAWAVYDPSADRWTHAGVLPPAARTAAQLDATHVALFGGPAGETVSVLDLATGTLTAAGHTRLPRGDSTAVALPDGAVLLLGGELIPSVAKEPEVWSWATGRSEALPGLGEELERQTTA